MAMEPGGKKRGVFLATVLANQKFCRDHFRLTLAVAARDFPPTAPGQFVQLNCHPPAAESDEPDMHPWRSESDPGLRTRSLIAPAPLLRRPFSIAGDRPHPTNPSLRLLEIIGRVIGLGTTRLAALPPGEQIDLVGPLGNSFPMPQPGQTALLVGGGVGIPPMIYLAERIAKLGGKAVAIAGVASADLLPLTLIDGGAMVDPAGQPTLSVEEFARHRVTTVIASDDGTIGLRGLATGALTGVLDTLALPADRLVIYTCGPERMMRAVAELAIARSIQVWVAMERAMACGIGTCQSCVCKVRIASRGCPPVPGAGGPDWQYKLVCTDGTIFDGREIVWG